MPYSMTSFFKVAFLLGPASYVLSRPVSARWREKVLTVSCRPDYFLQQLFVKLAESCFCFRNRRLRLPSMITMLVQSGA